MEEEEAEGAVAPGLMQGRPAASAPDITLNLLCNAAQLHSMQKLQHRHLTGWEGGGGWGVGGLAVTNKALHCTPGWEASQNFPHLTYVHYFELAWPPLIPFNFARDEIHLT